MYSSAVFRVVGRPSLCHAESRPFRRLIHTPTKPPTGDRQLAELFPWQWNTDSLPLRGVPSDSRSPLATYLLDPLKRNIGQVFTRAYVHHGYGGRYIENDFLAGSSMAFSQLFETLSDPESIEDHLSQYLAPRLRKRYSDALSALSPKGAHPKFSVHLHDAQISSYNVVFGPSMSDAAVERKKLVRLVSLTRYYRLGVDDELTLFKSPLGLGLVANVVDARKRAADNASFYQEGVVAMDEGGTASLEVVFDATVSYNLVAKSGGEVVFDVETRRDIPVVFEGRHVTQDRMRDGAALAGQSAHWRISDIDGLIEADLFEAYEKER